MRLLVDRQTDGPGLHALVIGVANYPHLIGGTIADVTLPLGLKQVRAPYATALSIADWLQNRYRSSTPLVSLDLRVSPPASHNGPPQYDRADMAGITEAFYAWTKRASSHPENLAFFYFCGHGLNKTSQLLLAEDFGGSPNPFQQSVDFDATLTYMSECAAQKQVYFIDACSNVSSVLNNPKIEMRGVNFLSSADPKRIPALGVYYAADEGEAAFAPDDGSPTYFSQALLTCLEKGCSQNKQGKWVADTGKLGDALQRILNRFVRRHGLSRLTVRPGKHTDVVELNEVSSPSVLTWLDCSTALARLESAILMMNHHDRTDKHRSPRGADRPWLHEVNPGVWRVDAVFNNYPRYRYLKLHLYPPCFEHEIAR